MATSERSPWDQREREASGDGGRVSPGVHGPYGLCSPQRLSPLSTLSDRPGLGVGGGPGQWSGPPMALSRPCCSSLNGRPWCLSFTTRCKQRREWGFPGGAVLENLPANAGDTGSSPGLGRSHMPRSDRVREPQLLSLRVWSLCSARREATMVRGPRTAMKSGPRLPQLEKALAQKRRPNTAKNKIN